MSAYFEDRKVGDINFTPILEASNFDSSTEKTSGISSCDEGDDGDNTSSPNTSGSSCSGRDMENNRRKQYRRACRKQYETVYPNPRLQILDSNLKLPPIQELTINSIPADESVPKLEDLTLDSDAESLTMNKIADLSLDSGHKPLAGIVTSIAKVIGLIVVKPPMPRDVLLYLGSPVFLQKSSTDLVPSDLKLGWIIDVFGPACEPYYCVKPVNNGIELVREGSRIFYSPDHPRTEYLRLKQEDGNRYTVLYSPRSPLLHDHRKAQQQGDQNFLSITPRGSSPHYQIRRRRHRGNNRGNYAHKNNYRHDIYAFPPIEPKHSYFDY